MNEGIERIIIDIISKNVQPLTFNEILHEIMKILGNIDVACIRKTVAKLVRKGIITKVPLPAKSRMAFQLVLSSRGNPK